MLSTKLNALKSYKGTYKWRNIAPGTLYLRLNELLKNYERLRNFPSSPLPLSGIISYWDYVYRKYTFMAFWRKQKYET